MGWCSEGEDPSFPPPPPPLASIHFIEQPIREVALNHTVMKSSKSQPALDKAVNADHHHVKPNELSYTQPLLIPTSQVKSSQYARPSTQPYEVDKPLLTADIQYLNTSSLMKTRKQTIPVGDICHHTSQPSLCNWQFLVQSQDHRPNSYFPDHLRDNIDSWSPDSHYAPSSICSSTVSSPVSNKSNHCNGLLQTRAVSSEKCQQISHQEFLRRSQVEQAPSPCSGNKMIDQNQARIAYNSDLRINKSYNNQPNEEMYIHDNSFSYVQGSSKTHGGPLRKNNRNLKNIHRSVPDLATSSSDKPVNSSSNACLGRTISSYADTCSASVEVLTPCNQGFFHHHHGYAPYTPPGSDTNVPTAPRDYSQAGSSTYCSSGSGVYAPHAPTTSYVPLGSTTYTPPGSAPYTPPGSTVYTPPGSAPYTPPASAPQTPIPPNNIATTDGPRKGGSNRRRRINSKYRVSYENQNTIIICLQIFVSMVFSIISVKLKSYKFCSLEISLLYKQRHGA